MEKKNFIQYLLLTVLIIMGVVALSNFFKTSNNLKESQQLIENVLKQVAESKALIQHQALTIDELKKLNSELTAKVASVDSTNRVIKRNLDVNFSSANRTLIDLKKTIESIDPPEIH